jgi:hypothetical protein
MKCIKCKTSIKAVKKYCSECGTKNDTKPVKRQTGLEGIGGWLYLIAIGLVISPLLTLGSLIELFDVYSYVDVGALKSVLLLEIIFNLVVFTLVVLVIYHFAKMKKFFPHIFTIFLITNVVILIVDNEMANAVLEFTTEENTETYAAIARSIIYAAIWIPYVYKSKRVKNTFIN